MRIFRNPGEIPSDYGPTAVSIGNFDGVHCGHQLILAAVRESARQRAARSVAVLFDPHPVSLLRPESAPRLITPLPARLDLLRATGIDAVLVLPFTRELSRMSAAGFAAAILRDALRAVQVHEGANFRFGHRAEGGSAELRDLGRGLGFGVQIHPPLVLRGVAVSSTAIRGLLAAGRLGMARALLGRVFSVRSSPAAGRGIGSRLTVPTINLAPYSGLLPANGVYVTRIAIGTPGEEPAVFDAITNAGNRPTFGADSFAVESHLLNFRPVTLTPETRIDLQFLARLRDERRWPSPEALKAQILRDAARASRYLALSRRLAPAVFASPGPETAPLAALSGTASAEHGK